MFYVIAWSIWNFAFIKLFLVMPSSLDVKFRGAFIIDTDPFGSIAIAFVIMIARPAFNNIGLIAKEALDKGAQQILKWLNWESYPTKEDHDLLQEQIKTLRNDRDNAYSELSQKESNLKLSKETNFKVQADVQSLQFSLDESKKDLDKAKSVLELQSSDSELAKTKYQELAENYTEMRSAIMILTRHLGVILDADKNVSLTNLNNERDNLTDIYNQLDSNLKDYGELDSANNAKKSHNAGRKAKAF